MTWAGPDGVVRAGRISGMFANLKRDGRRGLIAFLTAGDPSPARTPALVAALERGGADLIELGVPFSDPIADGPVIHGAGPRARPAGTTLHKVLEIAAEIRRRSEIPLLLFTYLNPVVRYGLEALAVDAAACGIDGCLLTDASVEEAGEYVAAMHRHHLDTVFLAAPTSTERRLRLVAQYSTGFVYLVSRTGVTGARESVSQAVRPLVESMRAVTNLPLAVGFGVSRPEHVAELGHQVEAVVVGSAIVNLIEKHAGDADPTALEAQLESFVRELKQGFDLRAVEAR
jgi:tryptophan synthase alpha chain